MIIKAITLIQPWASLIAKGIKTCETRRWPAEHRGLLAIHAGQKMHTDWDVIERRTLDRIFGQHWPSESPRLGLVRRAMVALCELKDCRPSRPADFQRPDAMWGYFGEGRWVWELELIEALPSFAVSGQMGLWDWDADQHGYKPPVLGRAA